MKIRQGFISNSSSTSFVLHVGEIDTAGLKKRIKQLIEDDDTARRTSGGDERVADPLTFTVQSEEGGCRIEFPFPFFDDQTDVLPGYINILINELGNTNCGFEDKNIDADGASDESAS